MFLGILVLSIALLISAVAIYYSVAGLVAIFASAAIPVIIMGGALETGKLVAAIWLHKYWHRANLLLKTYLSVAIVVLMLITSMGIFGFLSKAHIEQTAGASENIAKIEQIDIEISTTESLIARVQGNIEKLENQDLQRDTELQQQIDQEQKRIDTAYARIQPAIDEQQLIIDNEENKKQEKIDLIRTSVTAIDTELENLRNALSNNNIRLAQGIVGVRQDGSLGPNTTQAIADFRASQDQARIDLLAQIEAIRTENNTVIVDAREEIKRLRSSVEEQILSGNQLIDRLRSQLGTNNRTQVLLDVEAESIKLSELNSKISDLNEEKFALQAEFRKLEAEVGPIKYIAEFIYGEQSDKDLLEKAVRWVIIVIIFVFDPLAVILLIASQYTFRWVDEEARINSNAVSKTEDLELEINNSLDEIEKDIESIRSEIITDRPVTDNTKSVSEQISIDIDQEDSYIAEDTKKIKLYGPDGKVVAPEKTIKSIKIKNKE